MRNDIQNNNNEKRDFQRCFTEVRVSENLKIKNFYNKFFKMSDFEIQNATQIKTKQRLRKKINKLKSLMKKKANKKRKINEMTKLVIK